MKTEHTAKVKKAVEKQLLPWFAQNARDLPWRKNRTLYRVWISEIMLQQTRVETVIPYYNRWMKTFPTWRALANAPQSAVLKQWEGLGYYSRARNLHAAAKTAGLKTISRAPDIVSELKNFPGIGSYTASAIASLAYNADAAVVDGNVIRVLSRLFAYAADAKTTGAKKYFQQLADELLVRGRAGEYNEAMMELGALICLPKNPQCKTCPLKNVCTAKKENAVEKYPVFQKKKKIPHITVGAAVTINRKGEILIAQRRDGDMLAGLWEFPGGKQEPGETIQECIARELKEELGITVHVDDFFITVNHTYSHFKMTMHVYKTHITAGRPRALHCADFAWTKISNLKTFAYSKADLQVVAELLKMRNF